MALRGLPTRRQQFSPTQRGRAAPHWVGGQHPLSVGRALGPSSGRVFPILLTSVGRDIKQAIGVGQPFNAAGKGGVGMEYLVADAEEDADAMAFRGLFVFWN